MQRTLRWKMPKNIHDHKKPTTRNGDPLATNGTIKVKEMKDGDLTEGKMKEA